MAEQRQREIRTVTASAARRQWSELVNAAAGGEARIVVEKSGAPVAALISFRDLEWLRFYERKREEDFKAIDHIRAAFADVPDDELEREVEKAVAEARAELRREREAQRSAS